MLLDEFKPAYFDVREEGDVVVLEFTVPRLCDDQNVEQLGHDLFALVDRFDRRKVILSLGSVEYMTSSVLGKLITLHRKMHRREGRVVLCDLQPEVHEVMHISRLHDYFNVSRNIEEAFRAVEAPLN